MVNTSTNVSESGLNYFNVSGVSNGLYVWNVYCTDNNSLGGFAAANYSLTVNVTSPEPSVTALAPANGTVYEPYTTSVTFNLSTDLSATCKYSNSSGTAFESLTAELDSTGATSHSHTLSGLSNNETVDVFVRCGTSEGWNMTGDYHVSYSVAAPDVVINEVMPSGSAEWVELYNRGETQVNLTNWTVTHSADLSNVSLDAIISSLGYELVNLSGEPLSVNESYDAVYLRGRDSLVVDNYTINATALNSTWTSVPENYSVGRSSDGGSTWEVFDSESASPGSGNAGTVSVSITLVFSWNLVSLPAA